MPLPAPADRENASALAVHGIVKRFPGVVANDDISLEFRKGEIHVLLGENGAGKSTLIGLLAGMQQPDSGTISINGQVVRIASPRESLNLGIGTVFQHVLLVRSLTVLENLMLGGAWRRRVERDAALARFQEFSKVLGVHIDPDAELGRLSLGQQQQVEIIRALWHGGRVLILDEPTSMLTPAGVRELGQVMRRLRDQGVAIIFITHKLREAYEFGDRISILRLGRVVGELPKERLAGMSEGEATEEIILRMFGPAAATSGDAGALAHQGARRRRDVALDRSMATLFAVSDLTTVARPGETALSNVSFDIWPGEVFGIAGVDGNGQKELAEVLAGQRPAASGRIMLGTDDLTAFSIGGRRRLGMRYITDERLGEGTVGTHSVAVNLLVKEIGLAPFWWRGLTRWDQVRRHARGEIAAHDIRTPSEQTPIARLSGGNIQKVLLAREASDAAKVVIFNKPTYGLDLHNTRLARDRILKSAESGVATIVISTELDELTELCDRIGVMSQGHLRGIIDNTDGVEMRLGALMTGLEAA